jgi:hypothetical protein
MRVRSPIGRIFVVASLVATVAVCARSALATDLQLSVLYSNESSHIGTGQPSTAVIAWLTPETVTESQRLETPCPSNANCQFTWYRPGFRTDTVYPNERTCVHFTVPSDRVAAEFTETWSGGISGFSVAGNPDITWHTESTWGVDGNSVLPAGTAAEFGQGTIQGC